VSSAYDRGNGESRVFKMDYGLWPFPHGEHGDHVVPSDEAFYAYPRLSCRERRIPTPRGRHASSIRTGGKTRGLFVLKPVFGSTLAETTAPDRLVDRLRPRPLAVPHKITQSVNPRVQVIEMSTSVDAGVTERIAWFRIGFVERQRGKSDGAPTQNRHAIDSDRCCFAISRG